MKTLINAIPGPIAIVGGYGYIGSNLYDLLIRFRDDVTRIGSASIPEYEKYKTVFYLAGCNWRESEDVLREVYVNEYKRWLDLSPQDTRIIYAGSSMEWGKTHETIRYMGSLSPCDPDTLYGQVKKEAWDLTRGYTKKNFISYLRFYSVYGGVNDKGIVHRLIHHAKEGKWPQLSDPDIAYDFIHVDDVCSALIISAHRQVRGVAIGTGHSVSIGGLAQNIAEEFEIQKDPVWGEYTGDVFVGYENWYARLNDTAQSLRWKATIAIQEFIQMEKDNA